MNKPTREEIKEHVANLPQRNAIEITEIDSINSITFVFKYKIDANPVCRSINNAFGQWVYASVSDTFKHPHVSVSYRSKELSKCKYCGWLDGVHSQYCKTRR